MSFPFDANRGLILVAAELSGPKGSLIARLALDTGATSTMVSVELLSTIGYAPASAIDRVQVTTGSRIESVPRLTLTRLEVLGQERVDFPVLGHTLPPSASIDGLLGLDFLRGQVLNLDFVSGRITLS